MSFLYYIKEIYFYIIYYIIFLLMSISILVRYNLEYINNLSNMQINNIHYLNYNQINLNKLEWNTITDKKLIHYVEYYTIETIYYKILIIYFITLSFAFYTFLFTKWVINISYLYKKKYLLSITLLVLIIALYDIYNYQYNINNTIDIVKSINYNTYNNISYEPLYTIESIIDNRLFQIIFIITKTIMYVTVLTFNANLINRITIYMMVLLLLHIDPLLIIYSLAEMEFLIILNKIIKHYFGDDRN